MWKSPGKLNARRVAVSCIAWLGVARGSTLDVTPTDSETIPRAATPRYGTRTLETARQKSRTWRKTPSHGKSVCRLALPAGPASNSRSSPRAEAPVRITTDVHGRHETDDATEAQTLTPLTSHKISCRELSVHSAQNTLTTADTQSVNRRLARGQLHRLVRCSLDHRPSARLVAKLMGFALNLASEPRLP